MVLVGLHRRFEDDRALWQNAYDKAVRYLADLSKKPVTEVRDWLDATASRLTPIV